MIKQWSFQSVWTSQQLWFDSTLFDDVTFDWINPEYWHQQNKIVGSAQGRGTTWFVDLGTLHGALRHYRRGGFFGKLVTDQYMFHSWQTTRSYAEFHLLHQLRQSGVNVPQPIAAMAQRKGFFYRADILVEKIPNAQDLVAVLGQASFSEPIYAQIGKMVAAMHRAQVDHTDLNIHNILLDASQQVWLIDFDKCRIRAGDSWKTSNLERLLRSFRKEKNKGGIYWSESDWQAVLHGYHETL